MSSGVQIGLNHFWGFPSCSGSGIGVLTQSDACNLIPVHLESYLLSCFGKSISKIKPWRPRSSRPYAHLPGPWHLLVLVMVIQGTVWCSSKLPQNTKQCLKQKPRTENYPQEATRGQRIYNPKGKDLAQDDTTHSSVNCPITWILCTNQMKNTMRT